MSVPTTEELRSLLLKGDFATCAEAYRSVLASGSEVPVVATEIYSQALFRMGQHEAAEQGFREALALDTTRPSLYFNYGNCLHSMGRHLEAIAVFEQALRLDPSLEIAHTNLAIAHSALGRETEALECFKHAFHLEPNKSRTLVNYVSQLKRMARFEDALEKINNALENSPRSSLLHMEKADLFQKLGNNKEAEGALKAALSLEESPEANYNLGCLLMLREDHEGALRHFQEALRLNNSDCNAWSALGELYCRRDDFGAAYDALCRALQINPHLHKAWNNLSMVCHTLGLPQQAKDATRRALRITPHNSTYMSNALLQSLYTPSRQHTCLDPEVLSTFAQLESRCTKTTHVKVINDSMASVLSIGYVSADFKDHPVAFFILNILRYHNRDAFTIYAYSNNPKKDHVTQQIASHVDHWRDCFAMSDDKLAEQIREDEIDILVDLSGHTAGNRLLVFARKPAPVQVTWIGFPGTTGLKAMDYRITDQWFDPPGMTEKYHTETLVRLPHTNGCYRPDERSPEVSRLPALGKGTFTFASLNNPSKINDEVIATWARILTKVPHGRLMLGNANDEAMVTRLTEKFSALGVQANQLVFQKRVDFLQYMELHHEIDLALDPFPYNGGTTTFHSLYMGVPVVTLAGKTTPSRCGVAILSRVQLHDFVADTLDQYVDTALGWVAKPQELDAIRQSLRSRLDAPENQPEAVVGHLENAYKEMWSTFCNSIPSAGQVRS